MSLRALLAVLCLPLFTGPLHAWAPAGHKMSATIAFRLVSPERRREIADTLRRHPRFAEDFQAKLPQDLPAADVDEWIWQQASIWPDMARGFPPELKDAYHHGTWHYCNRPLFLNDADRKSMLPLLTVNLRTDRPQSPEEFRQMNVLQALEQAKRTALNRHSAQAERALALSWLFHLAGDIHQPLHSVSLFSPSLFPSLLEGDRGGNLVLTKPGERLHGVWDNFPGGDVKFKTARDRALRFLHDDEYKIPAEKAAENLATTDWFDESHDLAREYGYNEEVRAFLKQLDPNIPPEDRPKLVLSEEYLKTGGLIARQRVVTAGYRLGALLR
jgi:hypothetical protein